MERELFNLNSVLKNLYFNFQVSMKITINSSTGFHLLLYYVEGVAKGIFLCIYKDNMPNILLCTTNIIILCIHKFPFFC